jgi:hypothetical protein
MKRLCLIVGLLDAGYRRYVRRVLRERLGF